MGWKMSDIEALASNGKIKGFKAASEQGAVVPGKPNKKAERSGEVSSISSGTQRVIGVDTGTHTGVGVYDRKEKKLVKVATMMVHEAMQYVLEASKEHLILVVVEDARKRKYFGPRAEKKQQGAGSVKRDASIWEAFLIDHGIPYIMKHPVKGMTKMDARVFAQMTGWKGLTSEHARDGAMLAYGL